MPGITIKRSEDTPSEQRAPTRPTLVVASYKGGSWKTSIAVACAERIAMAGYRVLLPTVDGQEDALTRVGQGTVSGGTKLTIGQGTLTVLGMDRETLLSTIYAGPDPSFGDVDVIIADMPPVREGGWLPGTYTVVPLVDHNAILNAHTMLMGTPANTDVLLVRVGDLAPSETWSKTAKAIQKALGRSIDWLDEHVPKSGPIADAHATGTSIWTLPKRGNTGLFQDAIITVCDLFWTHTHGPDDRLPSMPKSTAVAPMQVRGWGRVPW